MSSTNPYKNPVPTVDLIIEINGRVVLIQRKNSPWPLITDKS
jgi:ADP-ribose pyrophosphatase YjhB (NUDIX family)